MKKDQNKFQFQLSFLLSGTPTIICNFCLTLVSFGIFFPGFKQVANTEMLICVCGVKREKARTYISFKQAYAPANQHLLVMWNIMS